MAKDIITIDNNEYQQWFQYLCEEIDRQRLEAVMQLNATTLQHYWWLGNDIIHKQKEHGWGAKVIDQLSADGEFVQVPLAQITWYHHISMLPKVKDFYQRSKIERQHTA